MTDDFNPPSGGDDDARLPPELRGRRFFRRPEASRYLAICHEVQLAPATLAKLAVQGGGPEFHENAGRPLYPRERLDAFAKQRRGPLQANTSQRTRKKG